MSRPRLHVEPPPIALSRDKAAAALDLSPTTFDAKVRPHVRCIREWGDPRWTVEELQRFARSQQKTTTGGKR